MRSIFYLCLIAASLSVYGCRDANSSDALKTIDSFYNHYKPGDFRVVDTTLLSKDLTARINLAQSKQSEEARKLKAAGSTDKPLMIEGDIYTSLYEGATQHQIVRTDIDEDVIKATVKFINEHYNNHTWTDTILLINEGGKWKIDDIFYTQKQGSAKSTKNVLNTFLNMH
ncbi:MAG: DUF3828 domain-containing protein [Bacteroidota bacterium]